jgi:hypothetical protein
MSSGTTLTPLTSAQQNLIPAMAGNCQLPLYINPTVQPAPTINGVVHHPPQPVPRDDTLQTDFNDLKAQHDQLRREAENIKSQQEQSKAECEGLQEKETARNKKWLAREKIIKAREAAITSREANQSERDEQITLLRDLVNKLEHKVEVLEEQNKLYKLRLLASEDLRSDVPNADATPPSSFQPLNASAPETRQHQLDNITGFLQTSILAATANLLANTGQQQARITNIYQPHIQYQGHIELQPRPLPKP